MIPEGAMDLPGSEIIDDTGKSWKVTSPDINNGDPVYIPKSVMVEDDEADVGDDYKVGFQGRILIQEWFAEKKGWL